jgi:Tfp pilus assembly protein FimT
MVELVVVMTIMAVVIGIAAPSLKAFMHGRSQEDEARRFLSLTRYGSSRAEAEGVPVDLWINTKQGKYGLAATPGYTETKTNSVTFELDKDVTMQVQPSSTQLTHSNFWTPTLMSRQGNLFILRFQPDGYLSDSSPRTIRFLQGQDPEVWIVQNANQTGYAIELNHSKTSVRL